MSLFHRHRWRIIAAHPAVDGSFGCHVDGTMVLYRCNTCGTTSTRFAHGRWTVEQLRGETS